MPQTEEEIKAVIKLGEEEGVLERQEKEMIHGVLNISEKVVREIMTPRIDTICIPSTTSIKEAIQVITTEGHSRVPLYEDTIDNIQGIIYAKDLLNIPQDQHAYYKQVLHVPCHTRRDFFPQRTKQTHCLVSFIYLGDSP